LILDRHIKTSRLSHHRRCYVSKSFLKFNPSLLGRKQIFASTLSVSSLSSVSPLHYDMPSNLLQAFHPENIPSAVSDFRGDGEIPLLDAQYFDGGQCRIFKVSFSDGECWSVRIPIHGQSTSQGAIINTLQAEQDVLKKVESRSFTWAPKHHGSSLTFANHVGFPFMVLSWIDGCPLTWTSSYPTRPIRDKVLAQLAGIQISLIESTQEDSGLSYPALDTTTH
jgi:hypothetical protein